MITGSVVLPRGMQSTVVSDIVSIRRMARNAMGKWVVLYLRRRVGDRGMGANGKLAGYSRRPITVSEDRLKKVQPAGGLPRFYKKGYWGYRKDVGLRNNRFLLTNTGYTMRSMPHHVVPGNSAGGDIAVFFPDPDSMYVANYSIDRGRLDMFDVNDTEMDKITDEYLKIAVPDIWDDFFGR